MVYMSLKTGLSDESGTFFTIVPSVVERVEELKGPSYKQEQNWVFFVESTVFPLYRDFCLSLFHPSVFMVGVRTFETKY